MNYLVKSEQEKAKLMFAQDVLNGLSQEKKSLPSKYLYNKDGDAIFRDIMDLQEYYPTRTEYQILKSHIGELVRYLEGTEKLQLVDLGAGDGLKTKILINHFLKSGQNMVYSPIDISPDSIKYLLNNLRKEFPDLEGEGISADYFEGLKSLREDKKTKKLVLFLGSNIGNFDLKETMTFLKELHDSLNKDDLLLIGFDLKKDPRVIIKAYDDKSGITAEFNRNLLKRINEELGGNFNPDDFTFFPKYDPETGELRSYLVSLKDQNVFIETLGRSFFFSKWETLHTECSNKYDLESIERIAEDTGFTILTHYVDEQQYFTDSLWQVG
ncbi:MAG: L-histidine N(alpha)-methyltransferase [Cytophagaceae bacterium]